MVSEGWHCSQAICAAAWRANGEPMQIPSFGTGRKGKPPADWPRASSFSLQKASGAEQQNARRLLVACALGRAYRAVEELVVFKIDLEERRPVGDMSGDKGF